MSLPKLGEMRAIQLAVIGGSLLPLAIFILWNGAILGAVSPTATTSADLVAQSVDALAPLRALSETSAIARVAVPAFSLCAIGTSYLGFSVGQTDVVVDALGMRSAGERPTLAYALALLPPLAVALLVPDVFAPALDAAGTFGVTTLYAALPAAIAWQQRYGGALGAEAAAARALPGGKAALLAVAGVALAIVGEGTLDALGFI
jgi:tyrosine-specific transport protein